jgi:hypothetical protein
MGSSPFQKHRQPSMMGVPYEQGCELDRSRKEDGRRCAGAACDQPQTFARNPCGTRTSTIRPRTPHECPVIRPGLLSLLERTVAANPRSRPDQVSYTGFPCLTPTAISKALQPTAPGTSAVAAPRKGLNYARQHIQKGEGFAVETTLFWPGLPTDDARSADLRL